MRDRLAAGLCFAVMSAGWLLLSASEAGAQTPPFFGGGVVAYDPIPATVFSGALLDAQAVVSEDRRYVTLNMRVSNNGLRQLVPFPVAQTNVNGQNVNMPQGFVGGVVFPTENSPSNGPSNAPAASGPRKRTSTPSSPLSGPSPDAIDRAGKSWILARQGMYLVAPLR